MDATIDPVSLLCELVRFPSVSTRDNLAITDYLGRLLDELGFDIQRCDYTDARGVSKANLVATRHPVNRPADRPGGDAADDRSAGDGLAYFAHTDVVPVQRWDGPGGPFDPVIEDGKIFGRGSCDMKGSLVAMIAAAARIAPSDQTAPIRIICTADEEVGFLGAKHLVRHCPAYRQIVQEQPLVIIGEPTCCHVVHAHKGIAVMRITSHGRAAHSSTRQGQNANLAMVPMLAELLRLHHCAEAETALQDDRFDPPTLSWNFGVSDHCDAANITPGRSDAWVSLRAMPQVDGASLVAAVEAKAQQLGLSLRHEPGCPPMWIDPDNPAVVAMCQLAGDQQPRTVCYGTDGGELSELTHRLVCGPGDIAQAHTSDEWIALEQLVAGIRLYHQALIRWCT